jgi:hypothetical protein
MARTKRRQPKTAKQRLEALKPQNAELACILKNDPARIQERVITPKKQKVRPRKSNRADKELGETI